MVLFLAVFNFVKEWGKCHVEVFSQEQKSSTKVSLNNKLLFQYII